MAAVAKILVLAANVFAPQAKHSHHRLIFSCPYHPIIEIGVSSHDEFLGAEANSLFPCRNLPVNFVDAWVNKTSAINIYTVRCSVCCRPFDGSSCSCEVAPCRGVPRRAVACRGAPCHTSQPLTPHRPAVLFLPRRRCVIALP